MPDGPWPEFLAMGSGAVWFTDLSTTTATWSIPEETSSTCRSEPNELVKSVRHHRMPVLLTSEVEYAAWLNSEIVERGPLEVLMRPSGDGVLATKGAAD